MTPALKKELAQKEAAKHMTGEKAAKEKVVVVMPFEAAWIDPTDDAMEAIRDFASDRNGSIHEFLVPKEPKEPKSPKEPKEPTK